MVGHSERRAGGETDEQVARKVTAVAESGLVPILFVGEASRGDDAIRHTGQRLRRGLSGTDLGKSRVLVVYEPAWAIGAEDAAPVAHVGEVVGHVKGVLRELGAPEPTVLYGGTVGARNIDDFAGLEVLDGVGATRASLDATSFPRLLEVMSPDLASTGGVHLPGTHLLDVAETGGNGGGGHASRVQR